MLFKSLFCIVCSLMLVSCISNEDDIRPSEKMIVVRGLISPKDSILKIALRQSIPFFNKGGNPYEEEYIKDAEVILSDGSRSIQLRYTELAGKGPDYGFYIADTSLFHIYDDQTYYLNVRCPDGRSVKASCNIPAAISNIGIQYDSTFIDNNWSRHYFYSLHWTNNMPREAYYRVYISGEEAFYDINYPYALESINEFSGEWYRGDDITKARLYNYIYFPYDIFRVRRIQTITILSMHKDDLSLLYQQSQMYQSDSTFSTDQLDGPLLNHDNILNTNIEGGLGFFVGYRYDTIPLIPAPEDETRDFPDSFSW